MKCSFARALSCPEDANKFTYSFSAGRYNGLMSDASYTSLYRDIDFRVYPEKYRIGRGEQGVLMAEPYKSEILPYWKFATPEVAAISAAKIYDMFMEYRRVNDFVGMDMARKFLQMGFTRSRRYANHKGGKKYVGPVPLDKKGQSGAHGREEMPRTIEDSVKAESARIFYDYYVRAREDSVYKERKLAHQSMYKEVSTEKGIIKQ